MPTKKLLIVRGSGPPNIAEDSFKSETYYLLAKGFVDSGIFSAAVILYLNSQTETVVRRKLSPQITVIHSPQNDILKGEFFDFVFVRAEFREYPLFLKNITYRQLAFYSATAYVFPRLINPRIVDIIYVNEKKDLAVARKKYPWIKAGILDKPVDETVFYPKEVRKVFDICCVANFRPRKHHAMLFEAINKLPNHPALKIVCVGNLFKSGYEAEMLADEYGLTVKYTNLVSLKKVAGYLRKSKISVLASKIDANPRSLYESLACGTPLLINSEMIGGTHLINPQTGLKEKVWRFDRALEYMLKNYKQFSPADFFKQHFTLEKIVKKLTADIE